MHHGSVAQTSAGIRWFWIGLLMLLYIFTCVRVARQLGRIGRSTTAWFLITLVCTAIPAAIVLQRHRMAEMRQGSQAAASGQGGEGGQDQPAAPQRCRHCGGLLGPAQGGPAPPAQTCPHCGMAINEANLA